jgi:predicted DNA-binding protein with PD1-like motif
MPTRCSPDAAEAPSGGHLLGGTVDPTLEVMIVELAVTLRRRIDPTTGLAQLDIGRDQS